MMIIIIIMELVPCKQIIWGGDTNDLTPDISSAVVVGAGAVSGFEKANKATAVIRDPNFWSEGTAYYPGC